MLIGSMLRMSPQALFALMTALPPMSCTEFAKPSLSRKADMSRHSLLIGYKDTILLLFLRKQDKAIWMM